MLSVDRVSVVRRMASRTRVYVGKLHPRTRERELYDAFDRYGRVRYIDMKYGFAFVVR